MDCAPRLAGCGVLTQVTSQGTGTTPGGKATRARFEAVAHILDNPQQIFSKAGYIPVFTATAQEAQSKLPKGLSVMPKEARTWEPWFKVAYTIKGQTADTASQLEFKSAIVSAATRDPALDFNAPLNPTNFISNALKAESDILNQYGVTQQDTVAKQIARLDMAAGWVMGRRSYGNQTRAKYDPIEKTTQKFTTFQQLLNEDLSLTCAHAITNMIYIVREMEKKSPTGVTVGGLYVFKFDVSGKQTLHAVVGAKINLPNGQKANLYYDPTPISNVKNPNVYDLATRFGPTSQAGLEYFANAMSIAVLPNDIKFSWPKGYRRYLWLPPS